jgi:aminotransferase
MDRVTLNLEKHLSDRAKRVRGSLGRQTSINIEGLINLGSGTPDFAPPDFVLAAMEKAIKDKKAQYTAWAGIPELRTAIAAKLARENDVHVDPMSEVLVTTGAQEALMVALMTMLDPGDHALTPSPHYDEYTRDAMILGGTLIPVPTTPETNFTIDVAALEAAITPKTKALVIVSPNNPTGTVLPRATVEGIARLAQERDLVVISDEIYEYYVFDGAVHTSMASLPGMAERTITINSFSKGYGMTGLRLGFLTAPANLLEAMLPFHHAMMVCASVVSQYGGLAALSESRAWFDPILAEYDRRRRLWMDTLDQLGLPYARPQGAYYIFVDIRPTGMTSGEFVARAREQARLTFQPGTIGGGAGEGFVRGALTTPSPKFEEGLARFTEFVRPLLDRKP